MKKYILVITGFIIFSFPAYAAVPFGEDLYVQIKPAYVTSEDLDMIAEAGFGGVRISILWYLAERKPGVYSYSRPVHVTKDGYRSFSYDRLVAELAKRNLKMLVLLQGGNPLYTGEMRNYTPPGGGNPRRLVPAPDDPDEIEAYSRFAAHTAEYFTQQYGTELFTWTIWNEPNLWIFYPPAPNHEAFAKLLTQSCNAIKTAVPDAIVAGPGFGTDPDTWWSVDIDYAKDMLGASNSLECLDALTFHPYRPVNPETVAGTYADIEEAIGPWQPEDRKVPIAVDEWGYSIRGGHILPVDAEKQGIYLTRAYLMNQLHGVPFTGIYEWRNRGGNLLNKDHNFGLVTHTGASKPGFAHFSHLLKELKGYILEERLEPQSCSTREYILLYGRAGDKKAAAWSVSGSGRKILVERGTGEKEAFPLNKEVRIIPLSSEDIIRCE